MGQTAKQQTHAATHLFRAENLCREMRKSEKQQTPAATQHFTRNNLCRNSDKGPDAVS